MPEQFQQCVVNFYDLPWQSRFFGVKIFCLKCCGNSCVNTKHSTTENCSHTLCIIVQSLQTLFMYTQLYHTTLPLTNIIPYIRRSPSLGWKVSTLSQCNTSQWYVVISDSSWNCLHNCELLIYSISFYIMFLKFCLNFYNYIKLFIYKCINQPIKTSECYKSYRPLITKIFF